MALSDYKLCDICGNKAFYDANITDSRYCATWDFEEAQETEPIGISVLCPNCNKTYKCVIQKR